MVAEEGILLIYCLHVIVVNVDKTVCSLLNEVSSLPYVMHKVTVLGRKV